MTKRTYSILTVMFMFAFFFATAFTITTESVLAGSSGCCFDGSVGYGHVPPTGGCDCNPCENGGGQTGCDCFHFCII